MSQLRKQTTDKVIQRRRSSETCKAPCYRKPEIVDLGKATRILQGGSIVGHDNFNQTYGF